jgi:RND family efflux transporter MFP subunit
MRANVEEAKSYATFTFFPGYIPLREPFTLCILVIVKKAFLTLIFLAVAGGGGWFFFQKINPSFKQGAASEPKSGRRAPQAVSELATVERRTLTQVISSSGDITPAVQVEVKPEISARIKTIQVAAGEHVKKDEVLIELDDKELLTEKASVQTEIVGAQVNLDKGKRTYERAKQLFERKLISQEVFENSKTDYDVAQNNLDKLLSKLRSVNDRLEKTKVLAPMDGTVLSLPVVPGQVVVAAASVNSGTLLMTVADLSQMRIITHINQVDITHLAKDQKVEVSVDSVRDKKMYGTVFFISPVASIKSNVKGFSVEVLARDLDPQIRPGMTANLIFTISTVADALSVPLSAVFTEDNESKVVYVGNGKAVSKPEKRPVEIGIVNFDYAEIKAGLKEGESVFLTKPRGTKDG